MPHSLVLAAVLLVSIPMLIALIALPLAIALVLLLRRRRRNSIVSHAQSQAGAPVVADAPQETENGVDEELVAVITAAVTVALRKAVTVRRVQFLHDEGGTLWSVTGRLNIMASHLITKRKF